MPMIEHLPQGDPCARCGVAACKHRPPRTGRVRVESAESKAKRAERDRARAPRAPRLETPTQKARRAERDKDRPNRQAERVIVGIDGEGLDAPGPDGHTLHLYTYLAAVDEHGRVHAEARNPKGLSHDECMHFLGTIAQNTLKFGFMFSYDLTKILEQMPSPERWYLLHPDWRRAKKCVECGKAYEVAPKSDPPACKHCESEREPREVTVPVYWAGRSYDFLAGSFTVGGRVPKGASRSKRKRVKVWDCFRFFGTSFVNSLDDWKIGTQEERDHIRMMKEKRGEFANESPADVENYCKKECHLLAVLMRKVIDSHERAGIPLKRFEGAGSTAAALLRKHKVEKYRGPRTRDLPRSLQKAIQCAFFGGRFENSTVGVVKGPVYGFDISSAYPYALTTLACLKCGRWKHVHGTKRELTKQLKNADYGVARFSVDPLPKKERDERAWGPLPCRDKDGSIVYGTNFTGWAWAEELLPALIQNPGLVRLAGEAWIYTTKCAHRPFKFMPATYRKRIEWGKEGPGKCLKLGMNASYGKCAQQVGGDKAPFHSLVWAGVTTATCRGQLQTAISSAKDSWSVLAVATDGIYATEKLDLDKPDDTGTGDLPKPLGGWEMKDGCDCNCDACKKGKHCLIERDKEGCSYMVGCFFAKPGLYYRMNATLADIRARGIGRKEVHRDMRMLVDGFLAWDRKDFGYGVLSKSRRFWGAKHSTLAMSHCVECDTSWVGALERGCPKCLQMGGKFTTGTIEKDGVSVYGTWGERETLIKFDPFPKRERRFERRKSYSRLFLRDLGGIESKPYDGKTTPEGEAARIAQIDALEQADWEEDDGDRRAGAEN